MRRLWTRHHSEATRLDRARRRRERARKGLAVLPSALTLGNLVCGFTAIVQVATVQFDSDGVVTASGQSSLFSAGLLILLAMVFDALDGRVARLTHSTSDFGAELDSLCDAVTFGMAPGLMVVLLNPLSRFPAGSWGKAAWVFGVAYACGAILRLARFNVENSHDEEAHNSFKGLPTPAAAGVIGSLVMLQNFLVGPRGNRLSWLSEPLRHDLATGIINALPIIALGLGYLMISRHRYVHVVNVYLRGKTPFDHMNQLLLLGAVAALLIVLLPELCAVASFGTFALSGPLRSLALRSRRRLPSTTTETSAAPGPSNGADATASPAPSEPGASSAGGQS
jgi:CDP-diacylglycerol---serine O-phosphatidyltransferase